LSSGEDEKDRRLADILQAFELGELCDLAGIPFHCERMMQQCSLEHQRNGSCACDNWDAKQGGKVLDDLFLKKRKA
jgi:hypothetical protein